MDTTKRIPLTKDLFSAEKKIHDNHLIPLGGNALLILLMLKYVNQPLFIKSPLVDFSLFAKFLSQHHPRKALSPVPRSPVTEDISPTVLAESRPPLGAR